MFAPSAKLEHIVYKNVSNRVIFFVTNADSNDYGLNTQRKKKVTSILYKFAPSASNMNFQTFLLPKVILARRKSQKIK